MSRVSRAGVVSLGVVLAVGEAAAQEPVPGPTRSAPVPENGASRGAYVRDVGPGTPGRVLRAVLAAPHDVVVAPDTGLTLGRDTRLSRTLLVLGGPVRLAAAASGNVVVVGDLFLRPGANVRGRAVSIGGEVYGSTLAVVEGGTAAYRGVTFDAHTDSVTGRVALSYRELDGSRVPTITWPAGIGGRLPAYNRVDGLAVAIGPEVALRDGGLLLEPTVTYRSQLGVVDPALQARALLGRRTELAASAERGTFTNDAWMRSDLVNSVVSLFAGGDVRNYYRADRARATLSRRFETSTAQVTPFVGALVERAWSVRRDSLASRPWSLLGGTDCLEGMCRPNPGVTGGSLASGLAGIRARVDAGDVSTEAWASLEVPVHAPGDRRFAQLTADARVAFVAFRDHRVDLFAHAVATVGDAPPSQRFAYLGGGPTLPSLPLLSLGGDRLLWTETRYTVPLRALELPFGISPRVTLRHMIGSAGIGRLPAFTQNLGVRLALGPFRLDYTFDPTGRGDSDFSVGAGFR